MSPSSSGRRVVVGEAVVVGAAVVVIGATVVVAGATVVVIGATVVVVGATVVVIGATVVVIAGPAVVDGGIVVVKATVVVGDMVVVAAVVVTASGTANAAAAERAGSSAVTSGSAKPAATIRLRKARRTRSGSWPVGSSSLTVETLPTVFARVNIQFRTGQKSRLPAGPLDRLHGRECRTSACGVASPARGCSRNDYGARIGEGLNPLTMR
jgi:hypothetical protein